MSTTPRWNFISLFGSSRTIARKSHLLLLFIYWGSNCLRLCSEAVVTGEIEVNASLFPRGAAFAIGIELKSPDSSRSEWNHDGPNNRPSSFIQLAQRLTVGTFPLLSLISTTNSPCSANRRNGLYSRDLVDPQHAPPSIPTKPSLHTLVLRVPSLRPAREE